MLDSLFGRDGVARDGAEILKALQQAARERILILDGAMGTEIQGSASPKRISAASASSAAPVTSRAITTF